MILADDNFATIIVAVEEGRKVFSNIQKTIQYLLSANTAEVLTIFYQPCLVGMSSASSSFVDQLGNGYLPSYRSWVLSQLSQVS